MILNTVCCHLPPLPPHSSTETSSSVDASVVQELQKALESTQRELRDMKDRKESFERECVIYQSQLEVHVHGVCVEEGGKVALFPVLYHSYWHIQSCFCPRRRVEVYYCGKRRKRKTCPHFVRKY